MAKKVIVVRIGTNEVQIVHMEHTANYPTVYGLSLIHIFVDIWNLAFPCVSKHHQVDQIDM